MDELKIIGWTDFDSEYPSRKCGQEDTFKIISLVKEALYNGKYVFAGEDHQNSPTGVPVLSDGTCFRASMRAWGSIMASMFEEGKFTYMDFYMSIGDQAVMPEPCDIDVEPAIVDEEADGCITQQDKELIEQSLSMGMPLMTTDKVLRNLFDSIMENYDDEDDGEGDGDYDDEE